MAVGSYRGVKNVARKVVKRYRGVKNVARKVVKRYRGVENVARLVFKSEHVLFEPEGSNVNFSAWNENGSVDIDNDNYIYFSDLQGRLISTSENVDYAAYSTLNFQIEINDIESKPSSAARLGITIRDNASTENANVMEKAYVDLVLDEPLIVSIDISEEDSVSPLYVSVVLATSANAGITGSYRLTGMIDKIWFE